MQSEERVADPTSPLWAEHRARYHFATQYLQGGVVVDIACGSGIGADVICLKADDVIGMDLDAEAVAMAALRPEANYRVCIADGTRIPLPDQSVNAIISFETVEHVREDSTFVGELRRVLQNQGVLVLSTPNALFTEPPGGIPVNPFHVREYLPNELQELLSAHFGTVEIVGQRTSSEFGTSPYWEKRENLRPRGLTTRSKIALWKVLVRLPPSWGERLSHLLLSRDLYPGEHDFTFDAAHVDAGHVLVAICRP